MAIWNKLFDNKKKKNEDDDGQEQYFKDEYKSVEKKAPEKAKTQAVKEAMPSAKATAPAPKKAASTEAKAAKPASKKAEEKPVKATAKSAASASKAAPTKKATEKPAAKSTSTTKATAASKPTAQKAPSAAKASPAKATKATTAKADTKAKATKELELVDDSPEVKGAVAVKEGRETANGKFDIRRAKDGRFFFSLYASNGAVIAYSQIYSSITAVNTGIASVIANAEKAEIEDTTLKKPVSLPCPKWEIYIDKAGEYRFRLYAINGLCVCHSSHGYSTKGGCKGGIESIRRYAEEATVDKSYLK